MELLQVSLLAHNLDHARTPVTVNFIFGSPDDFLDQDTADKVTEEWKVIYKECSARNPEAVTDIFKSCMGVFERTGIGKRGRGNDDDDDDGAHLRKCAIL